MLWSQQMSLRLKWKAFGDLSRLEGTGESECGHAVRHSASHSASFSRCQHPSANLRGLADEEPEVEEEEMPAAQKFNCDRCNR